VNSNQSGLRDGQDYHAHIEQERSATCGLAQQIVGWHGVATAGRNHHWTIQATHQASWACLATKNLIAGPSVHLVGPIAEETLGRGVPEDNTLRSIYGKNTVSSLCERLQYLIHGPAPSP